MISFKSWLISEEVVRSYKKANPKNPQQNFVILYGNTFPIKDELKKMGFRYFQGTWSTLEDKITDQMKSTLISLGVDLSGADEKRPEAPSSPPQITPPETSDDSNKTKADQLLHNMQADLTKAMKSEGEDSKLKNLVANIEKMIEHVANLTDEATKQSFIRNFLIFSSKFHNYSLTNQMLIWTQTKGEAQHVASPTNWTKMGRTIHDWSKGIVIFAPNFKNIEKENPNTGEKEKRQLKYFKAVKVYDVTATEPIPGHPNVFSPVNRKDWSKDANEDVEELNVLINALTNWLKEEKIHVDYQELSSELGGQSFGGKITINNKFKGVNLFSTLVHETAHEVLHWLEKGIDYGPRSKLEKESSKQQKEIDAETTAFIVCHHFGFETKDTPNYLALWRAKGDDIKARRQNVTKATKMIIEAIEKKVTESDIDFEPSEES